MITAQSKNNELPSPAQWLLSDSPVLSPREELKMDEFEFPLKITRRHGRPSTTEARDWRDQFVFGVVLVFAWAAKT